MYLNVRFYGKVLTIVAKCSVLYAAGALSLPQYALTCTAYRNSLIQVAHETEQLVNVISMYDHYI